MRTTPSPSTAAGQACRGGGFNLLGEEEALSLLRACERGEGWLPHCIERGIFVLPTRELAEALAGVIRTLAPRLLLEVGAGRGALARALRECGAQLIATDPEAPGPGVPAGTRVGANAPTSLEPRLPRGAQKSRLFAWGRVAPGRGEPLPVERLSAAEALALYRPDMVVSVFPPVDSDLDRQVLSAPSVRWYLTLLHAGPGFEGSERLWREAGERGFRARRLPEVEERAICRHDYLADFAENEVVRHTRAYLFARAGSGRGEDTRGSAEEP
ncbi:MAG: hypothetical protein ACE5JJ_08275 [Nitrospinota bacterium]